MKKGWILLIIVIFITILLFVSPTLDNMITGNVVSNQIENLTTQPEETNVAQECVNFGGEWFPYTQECKWVTEEDCIDLGGVFDECGPSCSNDGVLAVSSGGTTFCTQVCIPLCKM